MTPPSRWSLKRVALVSLSMVLLAQGLGAAVFLGVSKFSLLKQGDTIEYVRIADNVIAGRGYSAEADAPWRPTASRTPGMAVTNIPLRYFLAGSDALVTMVGKLILLAAALLTAVFARYYLESGWASLAAVVLAVIPSVAYYGINPYSTQPLYLLSFAAVYAGMVLVMQGSRYGAPLVGAASLYAISVRPAALFPLLALVCACIGLGFLAADRGIRRRLRLIGVAALIGMTVMYLGWSYRNQVVFGSFRYSSVDGFNLLHFNAAGMTPYLDQEESREVQASRDKLPIYIHRYHGPDQFAISSQQGEEGLRLIRKYPVAFLRSHLAGSVRSLFLFDVELLDRFAGKAATLSVAAIQAIISLVALMGLAGRMRTLDAGRRALILVITCVGLTSILSAGALGQPRFRMPLEPLVALGVALFIHDFPRRRFAGKPAEADR
jgi:uncharacterized membrane protein